MPHRLKGLRPSAPMVVALIALFVALDGPATAARFVNGASIKPNSITHRQIRNGTIGRQDLSKSARDYLRTTPADSVGANQLRDGAVGGQAIADKAVDGTKLGDGAVGASKLAPASVDATKLTDGAVGPSQLAAGAVTASKVATGAIGGGAIADGSLQTQDLGDFYGTVTVDFTEFAPNTCQVSAFAPTPSNGSANNQIADDVVSISPSTSGWPDPIIVTANPGANNTIRIVACRIGSDGPSTIDPPRTTFQYVAFDTP
ncbi:MAG TPA: hypothetical protein VFG42_23315 [Baekduia sp.]|uniref:hypothetical protein n=1 Tax=Baekduia sp. TaxID=2600305 RepID=UPI002D78E2B5|nr:hypothetical protein [Baekduia sp.]HET6509744.1 hypothetical protein [Baekduia sp.]